MTESTGARGRRGGVVRRIRGWIAATAAIAVVAAGLAVGGAAQPAQAADAAGFDPGYIISDENFFAPNAMSVAEIQAFLTARVPACQAGATCLKDYRQTTRTVPGTPMCSTYTAAANETAATIIWRVAQACGISPKVLLVTLQKEQGLVTSTAPSSRMYRSAMGAGCPDTAPCDAEYYGFFNQMHYGAYLMKRYTQPAGTGAGTPYNTRFDRMYPVGETTPILFHPNAACGTSPVTVRNQATHVLYVYTPYQPNGAALANMYGTGDGCSSYGNRNFYRFYTDWFGPTTEGPNPFGNFEAAQSGAAGTVSVSGWAVDSAALRGPIFVDVHIDGRWVRSLRANVARPDVGRGYPAYGPDHGFQSTIPAAPGRRNVCVYGINVGPGAHSLLGCRTVDVLGSSPLGAIEGLAIDGSTATIRGWAFDPDVINPTYVDVYVGGKYQRSILANGARADIARNYPGRSTVGYSATFRIPAGQSQVCAYAVNTGPGGSLNLGCRTVVTAGAAPRGAINSIESQGGTASVRGWAFDADSPSPIYVDAYVNGRWARSILANVARPDVQAQFPAQGPNHGFDRAVPLSAGANDVCLYAIGVGGGPGSALIGCQRVTGTAPGAQPRGAIESLSASHLTATAVGWAFDGDSKNPIYVDAYVNGRYARSLLAGVARPDIQAANPAQGSNHGLNGTVPISAGPNEVCLYAIGVGGGLPTAALGCRTVTGQTPPDIPPIGVIDEVTVRGAEVTVRGWAFDGNTTNSIYVDVHVSGRWATSLRASTSRPDVQRAYPRQSANHGFQGTVGLPNAGANQVCVYAINDRGAPHVNLGCRTVTRG